MQGYWYSDGYLRTSCREYNLKNATNRMIHLTNDAVQKKSEDYGRFESGNKVSSYPSSFVEMVDLNETYDVFISFCDGRFENTS